MKIKISNMKIDVYCDECDMLIGSKLFVLSKQHAGDVFTEKTSILKDDSLPNYCPNCGKLIINGHEDETVFYMINDKMR